ncbi:unnamed protein product [Cochlearia groenlandica]
MLEPGVRSGELIRESLGGVPLLESFVRLRELPPERSECGSGCLVGSSLNENEWMSVIYSKCPFGGVPQCAITISIPYRGTALAVCSHIPLLCGAASLLLPFGPAMRSIFSLAYVLIIS